jgi:hypothetical protein
MSERPIKHRILVASALAILFLPGLVRGQQQAPLHVSLVQLIATPERYDGKLVSVVGFLAFSFEGDWLSLHKEDHDNDIGANSLQVDRTKQMLRDIEKLDRNYVLIVGVFRREENSVGFKSHGHIVNTEKCELWSQPSHPRNVRIKEMETQEPKQEQ